MKTPTRIALGCLLLATAACERGKVEDYRGTGFPADTLGFQDQVLLYRAVLWASFPMDDPSLSILVDPLLLPRKEGLEGGDAIPQDVVGAMRSMGLVKGICSIPIKAGNVPLICSAENAGYAVRFSQPYRAGQDTVQVHMVAQNYSRANDARIERLRFEKAYILARTGTGWKGVREGRLRDP
jgi:hypothetical protein